MFFYEVLKSRKQLKIRNNVIGTNEARLYYEGIIIAGDEFFEQHDQRDWRSFTSYFTSHTFIRLYLFTLFSN